MVSDDVFLNNNENEQPKKQEEEEEGFTLEEATKKYEEEKIVKDKLFKVLAEKVEKEDKTVFFPLNLGNILKDKFFPYPDLEKKEGKEGKDISLEEKNKIGAEYNEKMNKHIFYQMIIGSSLPSEANYNRDKGEKFFVFDEIDEKMKKIVESLTEKIKAAAEEKKRKINGEELENILEEVLKEE